MNQISENTIYTDEVSKKVFLADKQRVIDAFLINFLGQVGLYQHGKKAKLVASLKADDNIRLNAITDEHKDLAVTMKAAFQIGAIKLANGNRFTKFILELKQGKLQPEDVTDASVRQLLKGINFKAFLPSQKMKVILNDFIDGGALSAAVKAIYQLVKVNKQYATLGQEFMELARQYVGMLGDDAQAADDRVFGVKIDADELKAAIAINDTPKADIAKEIFGAAGSKAYDVARKYGIDLTVKAAVAAVADWFEQNKPEVVQNISINNWLKGMGKAMIAAGDTRSWFIGWLIAGQESVRANLPHPIETLSKTFAKQPKLITGAQGVFGKDVTALTRYVAGVVKKVVIDGLQGQYGTDNFLPRSEDSVQTFNQYAKAGYDLNAILPSDTWFRLAVLVAANKVVGTTAYFEAIKTVGAKQRMDGEKIVIDVSDAPEKFKVSFADYIEAGVIKLCGTNVAFELPKAKPEITESDIEDLFNGKGRKDINLSEDKEAVLAAVKRWSVRTKKFPQNSISGDFGLWIKAEAPEVYSFLSLANLYSVATANPDTDDFERALDAYTPSDKLPPMNWNGRGAVDLFIAIRESLAKHLSSKVSTVAIEHIHDFVSKITNFMQLVEQRGINTVDGLVGSLIKDQQVNRRMVLLNALRGIYKGSDALFMALAKRIDLKVNVVGDQIQIEDSEDIADIKDYLRAPVVVLTKDKETVKSLNDDDASKIVNATDATFEREIERLGFKENEIAEAFIRWLDSASKARIDSIKDHASFFQTNPMVKKLLALGDVGVQAILLFNVRDNGFVAINNIIHLIPTGRITKFEPWFDVIAVRANAILNVTTLMLEGGTRDGAQHHYGDAGGKLFKRLDDKIGLDASRIPDSSPRRMMAFYDVVPNESMGDAIKTKLTKIGYGVRFEEKKLVIDVSKDEFALIDFFKLLTGGNVKPELTVDYGKIQTEFEILFSDARSSEEMEYLKGVFDYAELDKIKDSLETAIAGRDVIKDLYNWMSKGGVSVPLKIASIVEGQIVKLIPNKIEKFGDGKLALKFYSRMVDREYGLNFVRTFGTIFSRIDIDFLREVFLNNLASPDDDVVRKMVEIFASAGVTHRTVIDWMKEANVPTKIIMGKISKSPLAIAALTVEEKKEVYGAIVDETYQTMFLSNCGDDIAKVVDEDEMVRLATADHFGHVIPAARVIYDALPTNRRAECIERMVSDTSHLKGKNLNRAFLFDQTYTLEVIQRNGPADFAAKYSTFFGIDTIVAALPSSFVEGILNNEDKIKQYSEILLETGGEGPAQVAAYINKHHDVIAYVGLLKSAILLYGIDVVRLVDNNLIEESLGLIAKDVALSKVLKSIKDDPSGIKPLYNLSPMDVKNIIRFNDLPAPKALKRKVGESPIEYLNRIKAPSLERIAVEAMPDDAETLARQSIEYHRFNSGKHGKIFVKFLKSYIYNAKNIEAFEQFRNDLGERGVDNSVFEHAFHGTGSAVAPMILRNGFKVIKSKEGIKAGRMLGDGIYFSNVLDKVASYVGDMNTNNNGYGRRYGTRGYIFEMDALLGVRGEDYQSAGISGATSGVSVISPEWCVVDHNKQLLIKKVHLVEIASMEELDRIAAKFGSGMIGENVMEIKTFKQHLANKTPSIEASYVFVFRDGKIPLLDGTSVSYDEFEESENIKKYMTQYGPAVEMTGEGLDEPRYFDVLSTTTFMADAATANFYAEAIRKSI